MDNAQVAHSWAQQLKSRGNAGNFSFEGEKLFSYSTEIARFVDSRVIYTKKTYSHTTQRHQSDMHASIRQYEKFSTQLPLRDFFYANPTFDKMIAAIFLEELAQLDSDIVTLKTARVRIAWNIERIQGFAIYLIELATKYKKFIKAKKSVLNHLHDLRSNTHTTLTKKYKIDVSTKLAKEVNKAERDEQLAKAKAERYALSQAENIEKWRNGQNIGTLYNCPVMLRLLDTEVQTSHGARVPLWQAEVLYKALKRGSNIVDQTIGEFTVRELTSDTLIIGCHKIPLKEIESFAVAQNW